MAAPPAKSEITAPYPAPSNSQARVGFDKLYDYITGLLGSTGNAQDAINLLFPNSSIVFQGSMTSGVIDNVVIGSTTKAAGTFTTLKAYVDQATNISTPLSLYNNGTYGVGSMVKLDLIVNNSSKGYIQAGQYSSGKLGLQLSGSGSSTHLTIDSNGNLLMGSYQHSATFKTLDLGSSAAISSASGAFYLTSNIYYNNNWYYKTSSPGAYYSQNAGAHVWGTISNGPQDTIAGMSDKMSLFANGDLVLSSGTVFLGSLEAGYRDIPVTAKSASYTLALTDRGTCIRTNSTVAIPPNSIVSFPVGSTIVIYNNSVANISITIANDTLRWAGTANTGTRTLGPYGQCTLLKQDTTLWVVSGAGVS